MTWLASMLAAVLVAAGKAVVIIQINNTPTKAARVSYLS